MPFTLNQVSILISHGKVIDIASVSATSSSANDSHSNYAKKGGVSCGAIELVDFTQLPGMPFLSHMKLPFLFNFEY